MDTHVPGGDRIFRIDAAHKATIALATDSLHWPNGITWDKSGNRFIIVPCGQCAADARVASRARPRQ